MSYARFNTLTEALEAGFRFPDSGDTDISPANSQGVHWRSPDGAETVDVRFRDDLNRMGWRGCYRVMFPPRATEARA